jgi:hypothetical protein
MFDFIDLKQDGVLDLDEWLQTFIRFDVKHCFFYFFLDFRLKQFYYEKKYFE